MFACKRYPALRDGTLGKHLQRQFIEPVAICRRSRYAGPAKGAPAEFEDLGAPVRGNKSRIAEGLVPVHAGIEGFLSGKGAKLEDFAPVIAEAVHGSHDALDRLPGVLQVDGAGLRADASGAFRRETGGNDGEGIVKRAHLRHDVGKPALRESLFTDVHHVAADGDRKGFFRLGRPAGQFDG